jgi:hypothetical protein
VGYANPYVMLLGHFVDESAKSVASVDLVGWLRAGEARAPPWFRCCKLERSVGEGCQNQFHSSRCSSMVLTDETAEAIAALYVTDG